MRHLRRSPNFHALIMRHVAMLIIFSRRVLIRATPVYVYIDIGALMVDTTGSHVFPLSLQLQRTSLNDAPPGPEGSFPCSNYAPPKVGN
jgi:hypothetical protein